MRQSLDEIRAQHRLQYPNSMSEVIDAITTPEQVCTGAVIFHNGKPHTITHVEHIRDPWTQRPSLKATIGPDTTIVLLLVECGMCGLKAALKWDQRQAEVDWIELRIYGTFYWLCPDDADPIIRKIAKAKAERKS